MATRAQVWQVLQVQQQLLNGVQALEVIASNHMVTLGSAATDLIAKSNAAAIGFTVVDRLIASPVETLFADVANLDAVANSLSVRLSDLAGQLIILRSSIAAAAADPAKQMAMKIEHAKLTLEYRSSFSIVLELTQPDVAAAQTALQGLKGLKDFYNQVTALTSQIQSLVATVATAFGTLQTPLQTQLPGIATPLLSSFLTDVTDALGISAVRPCEIIRKGQQVTQSVARLANQLQQSVQTAVADLDALAQAKVALPQLLALIPIPQQVTLSYDFNPTLKEFPPVFTLGEKADFTIHAQTTVPLTGGQPTYQISATLTEFNISLIGEPDFITVEIDSFTFTSNSGASPDCHIKINKVDFGEELSFVSELADLLNPSEGPFLEFAEGMIETGFRFQVPTIIVGAFNLMQLSINVSVGLPFNGDPVRCDFSISTMDSPFLLSSGIYGGGGFLGLLLGLDGVQKLEGALEFGVVADINIGPVGGGGYVMAGIYFSIDSTSAKVCGFVHAHGHVDMFDIVSMDIDVYVAICYQTDRSVSGTATITVHVEILFFSADFKLTASYAFAGSDSTQTQSTRLPSQSMSHQAARASALPSPTESSTAPQQLCDLDPDKWRTYFEAFAA